MSQGPPSGAPSQLTPSSRPPADNDPLPRFPLPWLVALLVAGAWWPLSTYWLSDDWIAVHYAADATAALRDFVGNQYDLAGVVWFYRPLVTLSFVVEQLLGSADPFVSHLTNALVHGASAMLLGMLVCRFLGPSVGWWTALIWGTAPAHGGVVLWACGRTAVLAVPWILLAALLTVRWCDGSRRARRWAVGCFVLALATKEIAVVTPGIIAVLCAILAPRGQRVRDALSGSWPFMVVLAIYFGWRYLVLGHLIGGYSGEMAPAVSSLAGLGTWTGREVNPLTWASGEVTALPDLPASVPATLLEYWWVGFAPALVGAVMLTRRHGLGAPLAVVLLYLGCVAPCLQFWAQTDNPHNLRLFYLPFTALAVVLAAGRAWTAVPALLVAALPHLEIRNDYLDAFAESERTHRTIRTEAAVFPDGPVFVAGLPRHNGPNNVVTFHLGVDRLLQPPFGDGRHRVLALRPLAGAGAPRIAYGERLGVPHSNTLAIVAETGAGLLAPDRRPGLVARVEGPTHLTSEVLAAIHEQRLDPAFEMGTPRAARYRITIFTAGGYVTATLANEAAAAVDGGRVSLRSWLEAPTTPSRFVVTDLVVPTTLDLDLNFPVLIEAGTLVKSRDDAEPAFKSTHVAHRILSLQFDRDYATFIGS